MVSSQQLFGAWLRDRIAPVLREQGFAGSGQDFHRRLARNWAAINIQRSSSSDAEAVAFTINVGTKSTWVLEDRGLDPERPVAEIDCDWRQRAGTLVPANRDVWWRFGRRDTVERLDDLATEVTTVLVDYVVPACRAMADDRQIADAVLKGYRPDSPASLDILGPILRAIGPPDTFQRTIAAIESQADAMLDLFRFSKWHPTPRIGAKRRDVLLEHLRSKNEDRRALAAGLLRFAPPAVEVDDLLESALDDASPYVRGNAAESLGVRNVGRTAAKLVRMLGEDPNRYAAVGAGLGLVDLAKTSPGVDGRGWRQIAEERRQRAAGYQRGAFLALSRRLASP